MIQRITRPVFWDWRHEAVSYSFSEISTPRCSEYGPYMWPVSSRSLALHIEFVFALQISWSISKRRWLNGDCRSQKSRLQAYFALFTLDWDIRSLVKKERKG